MTAKHRDPEFRKNAKLLRAVVARKRRLGQQVDCWRCGHEIVEGQSWDVGHIDPEGGHGPGNLAPEHRYKSGVCRGNRSAGGSLGRARQQTRAVREAGLLSW